MSATAVALLGLGALHGINPGMGWLFAVALGIQEGKGRAVWRALPPLALGHALAIVVALATAAAIGVVLPLSRLEWVVAALLVGLGVSRLVRHRHPRYGGMRVTQRQLTTWSFLMASAHGAGLMVVPFVLAGEARSEHAMHASHTAGVTGGSIEGALAATAVHTIGYLAIAALLAFLVYRRLGLRVLRSAWINLDLLWACALILTGVLIPLV
jgi:hypothetical protein